MGGKTVNETFGESVLITFECFEFPKCVQKFVCLQLLPPILSFMYQSRIKRFHLALVWPCIPDIHLKPFRISMALQWLSKGKQDDSDEGEWRVPEARVRRAAATSMRRQEREAASKNNTAATEASKAAAAEPEAAEEAVATEAAAATAEAAAATAKTAGKDMKYDLQEKKMLEMEQELQVMKRHLNNLQDEVNGLRRTCDLLWNFNKFHGTAPVHQTL